MEQTSILTLEQKILMMEALLSNYELLYVQFDERNGMFASAVTSISGYTKMLVFERLFAEPVIRQTEVTGIHKMNETDQFIVKSGQENWRIVPLRQKPQQFPEYPRRIWRSLADFLYRPYYSETWTYYTDDNQAVWVLDPHRLGTLSSEEYSNILYLMNRWLDGHREAYQQCRSVYVAVPLTHPDSGLTMGLFDVARFVPINRVHFSDEDLTDMLSPEDFADVRVFLDNAREGGVKIA